MQQHIINAIDMYVNNPHKACWCDWQLYNHHGETGINRANRLKYYLIVSQSAYAKQPLSLYVQQRNEDDFFWEVLDKFMQKKMDSEFLRKICTTKSVESSKSSASQLNLQFFESEYNIKMSGQYKVDAKLLNGGNKSTSSLRNYINTVIPINFNAKNGSSDNSTSYSPYTYLFVNKSSGFDADESGITVSENDLTQQSTIKQSAHVIRKYLCKKDKVTLYFSKDLSKNNKMRELENYAAEVVYASIWQWFLGGRISTSLLRLNSSNEVAGICSKGLPGFIEFASMPLDQALMHKGLVSIIFYAYLLFEDDLHIKNIGLTTYYSGRLKGKTTAFAKIDHDYLATNWNPGGGYFVTQFPESKIREVVKSPLPYTFVQLFQNFRFSPGTKNGFFLQLGHTIRPKPNTTRCSAHASKFITGLLQRHYQRELKKTVEDFKLKCKEIDLLEEHVNSVFQQLAVYKLPDSKAKNMTKVLIKRIKSVALYGN
ncbi:MAG: hypothetical protein GY750_05225 [Lentisphaerae bacterium]|nr:hypothetical protein [Lentisphaerota bacterium]MCP4100815.1 hypothetical protein [Lentisphaerota bacterium]